MMYSQYETSKQFDGNVQRGQRPVKLLCWWLRTLDSCLWSQHIYRRKTQINTSQLERPHHRHSHLHSLFLRWDILASSKDGLSKWIWFTTTNSMPAQCLSFWPILPSAASIGKHTWYVHWNGEAMKWLAWWTALFVPVLRGMVLILLSSSVMKPTAASPLVPSGSPGLSISLVRTFIGPLPPFRWIWMLSWYGKQAGYWFIHPAKRPVSSLVLHITTIGLHIMPGIVCMATFSNCIKI